MTSYIVECSVIAIRARLGYLRIADESLLDIQIPEHISGYPKWSPGERVLLTLIQCHRNNLVFRNAHLPGFIIAPQ